MEVPKVKLFDELATIFNKHGFKLYMVGGTSRDFLLGLAVQDYDFATNASPQAMESFLKDADFRFAKFGTVLFKHLGEKAQITTLRTEKVYGDYRHPLEVTFVENIKEDYVRRDFTINALYIDANYEVFDFANGLEDLKRRVLRTIGEPTLRFSEDPLRMIRALRFIVKFNLRVEKTLESALYACAPLVANLNPQKISEEERKVSLKDRTKFNSLYGKYRFPKKDENIV